MSSRKRRRHPAGRGLPAPPPSPARPLPAAPHGPPGYAAAPPAVPGRAVPPHRPAPSGGAGNAPRPSARPPPASAPRARPARRAAHARPRPPRRRPPPPCRARPGRQRPRAAPGDALRPVQQPCAQSSIARRAAVPGRRRPSAAEQPQPVTEPRRHFGRGQHRDARGGHLDGERQPVERGADPGQGRGIGIGQDETLRRLGRPRDEKLHGGKCQRRGGVEPFRHRRRWQRCEPLHRLSRDAEPLAAGGQHAQRRAPRQQQPGQRGDRLGHMLAIVEDQQQVLAREQFRKTLAAGLRGVEPEGARDGGRHRIGTADIGQIDPSRAAPARPFRGNLPGQAGLADAAGPGKRDQARLGQAGPQLGRVRHAPDQVGGRVSDRPLRNRRGGGVRVAAQQQIAASGNILDPGTPVRRIAQGAAQRGEMDRQVVFLDDPPRPHRIEQGSFGHHTARRAGEAGQQVERPSSQLDWLPRAAEPARCRGQDKRSEPQILARVLQLPTPNRMSRYRMMVQRRGRRNRQAARLRASVDIPVASGRAQSPLWGWRALHLVHGAPTSWCGSRRHGAGGGSRRAPAASPRIAWSRRCRCPAPARRARGSGRLPAAGG